MFWLQVSIYLSDLKEKFKSNSQGIMGKFQGSEVLQKFLSNLNHAVSWRFKKT